MRKNMITIALILCGTGAAQAQDWANLQKYEKQNQELLGTAAVSERVVYMGDSITDFWIGNDAGFFSQNNYLDRGISGQTTGQMLLRFRNDVINLHPAVVVILGGINDIAENNGPERIEDIFGNLISMAQLATANHIRVVFSSLLPAFALPWKPVIDPVPQVKALNQMLKAYAAVNDMVYLDYFSAMADARSGLPANLSKDGVHPNLEGYKIMEPLAQQAIGLALEKP
jgi:lysophospholipase L1-like esterase